MGALVGESGRSGEAREAARRGIRLHEYPGGVVIQAGVDYNDSLGSAAFRKGQAAEVVRVVR